MLRPPHVSAEDRKRRWAAIEQGGETGADLAAWKRQGGGDEMLEKWPQVVEEVITAAHARGVTPVVEVGENAIIGWYTSGRFSVLLTVRCPAVTSGHMCDIS